MKILAIQYNNRLLYLGILCNNRLW